MNTIPDKEEYSRNKHTLTDDIKTRLKELQKKKGYSNYQVADQLGIPETTYKNIIRKTNGNKFLTQEMLKRFIDIYDCDIDYILCQSNSKFSDIYESKIEVPINFSIQSEKWAHLSAVLRDNYQLLSSLHVLLIDLPPKETQNIINTINWFASLMQRYPLLGRQDSLSIEKFKYLQNMIDCDSKRLTEANMALGDNNRLFSGKNYSKALNGYLKMIYEADIESEPAIYQAIKKVIALSTKWGKFPTELNDLVNLLSKYESSRYFEIIDDIKQKIKSYLFKSEDNSPEEIQPEND